MAIKIRYENEWEKANKTFIGDSWKQIVSGKGSVLIIQDEETNNIIMETGDALLLETGDILILE